MSTGSWKAVVPEGVFWQSLDPVISSTVVGHLSPAELNHPNLDPSLSNPEKLDLLEKTLIQKLPLVDNDYTSTQSLNSALFHIYRGTGDLEKQEKVLLQLVGNPSPNGPDLPALQNLAALYEDKGEHAKAEKLARETLPLLQGHPVLGKDSPQSLGSLRILINALWKQGKTEEAEQVIQEARSSIDNLEGGQFAAYQQEEKDALDKVVAELKK